MTNPTDERRAMAMAEADGWDWSDVIDEEKCIYMQRAKAIRESDEAAGYITTPRVEDAEVREVVAVLRSYPATHHGSRLTTDLAKAADLIERLAAEKLRLEHLCEGYRLENEELNTFNPETHVLAARGSTKLAEVLARAIEDETGYLPSLGKAIRILADVLDAAEGALGWPTEPKAGSLAASEGEST